MGWPLKFAANETCHPTFRSPVQQGNRNLLSIILFVLVHYHANFHDIVELIIQMPRREKARNALRLNREHMQIHRFNRVLTRRALDKGKERQLGMAHLPAFAFFSARILRIRPADESALSDFGLPRPFFGAPDGVSNFVTASRISVTLLQIFFVTGSRASACKALRMSGESGKPGRGST
jgi:hypothetical protein